MVLVLLFPWLQLDRPGDIRGSAALSANGPILSGSPHCHHAAIKYCSINQTKPNQTKPNQTVPSYPWALPPLYVTIFSYYQHIKPKSGRHNGPLTATMLPHHITVSEPKCSLLLAQQSGAHSIGAFRDPIHRIHL